jgi:hypothetical protein
MDWVIVEVVVGLAFLFFVISIVASAVQEAIAAVFQLRARQLERGVINLLTGRSESLRKAIASPDAGETAPPESDSEPEAARGEAETATAEPARTAADLLKDFFNNPLISSYRQGGPEVDPSAVKAKLPNYLSSRSFRNAMMTATGLLQATAEADPNAPDVVERTAEEIEELIGRVPNAHLRRTLTMLWQSVNKDVSEFRTAVERWFDRAMERVSGWYKRRVQLLLFVIGIVVAVAVNADAIRTADVLWKQDGSRSGLVAQLGTAEPEIDPTEALAKLDDLGFPLGWSDGKAPDDGGEWAHAVLGWILTGFAVTFGAPFWFDFLGKVSNLRAAGKKPESSLDKEAAPPVPALRT